MTLASAYHAAHDRRVAVQLFVHMLHRLVRSLVIVYPVSQDSDSRIELIPMVLEHFGVGTAWVCDLPSGKLVGKLQHHARHQGPQAGVSDR